MEREGKEKVWDKGKKVITQVETRGEQRIMLALDGEELFCFLPRTSVSLSDCIEYVCACVVSE